VPAVSLWLTFFEFPCGIVTNRQTQRDVMSRANFSLGLTVGAVYVIDRAFLQEWDERAVIDRAYSRKWGFVTLDKSERDEKRIRRCFPPGTASPEHRAQSPT